MTTRLLKMGVAAILLASCSERDGGGGNSIASPSLSKASVSMDASYNSALGRNVGLSFKNETSVPICFLSNDLLPGFGSTYLRDASGRTLSGEVNPALEEYRGLNVAGGISVIRPGQSHTETLDIGRGVSGGATPSIVQVGIQAFRCSDLFNEGQEGVRRVLIERAFTFNGSALSEYRGPALQNGEEPPPPPPR